MQVTTVWRQIGVTAATLGGLAACHAARPPAAASVAAPATAAARDMDDEMGGRVITAAQIRRWRVNNAWEAMRRSGSFRISGVEGDEQGRLSGRRGPSSIVVSAADTPLLFVDGSRVSDVGVLRSIAAHDVATIRVLGAADATTRFGTGGSAGAILVSTWAGIPTP